MNRLLDIFPAKMGLIRIGRELQFWHCNHDKPCRSLHDKRRRMLLEGEEGSWEGYCKQSPWLLIDWVLSGKKKSHSCSCWALLSLQDLGAPSSDLLNLFNWGFCLLSFYIFPFWSRSFSENTIDQESGFLTSMAFCHSVSGRTSPECSVSNWRESTKITNLFRLHLNDMKG